MELYLIKLNNKFNKIKIFINIKFISKLIDEKLRKLKFIKTIIKSIIIFVFLKKNIGSSKLKRIKNKLKKKINSLGLKKLSKSSDR